MAGRATPSGTPPPVSTHILFLLSPLLLLTPSTAQSCASSVPNATLVGLTVSAGCTLHPPFHPNEHYYSCAIPHAADFVSLTPIPAEYYQAQVEVRALPPPATEALTTLYRPPNIVLVADGNASQNLVVGGRAVVEGLRP
jgi:hypothetical protein